MQRVAVGWVISCPYGFPERPRAGNLNRRMRLIGCGCALSVGGAASRFTKGGLCGSASEQSSIACDVCATP